MGQCYGVGLVYTFTGQREESNHLSVARIMQSPIKGLADEKERS